MRYHYGHRGHNGNYSKSELESRPRLDQAPRRKADLFVYFNNDWCGYAPRNAAYLRRLQ